MHVLLSAGDTPMGTAAQNDPFHWDSDTLSKELCSQSRLWAKNPASLAAKLANEDVDGFTLLTYEFHFSRKELQETLGLITARSKAGLAEAILSFQARSPAFRSWKKDWSRRHSVVNTQDEGGDVKDEVALTPLVKPNLVIAPDATLHGYPPQHQPEQRDEAQSRPIQDAAPLDSFFFEPDADYAMQIANGDSDPRIETDSTDGTALPPSETVHSLTPTQQSEEQPSKRRRLAPTNLMDKAEERSNDDEHSTARIPSGYAYLAEVDLRSSFAQAGYDPGRSPTPSYRSESVVDLNDLPDSWDEETQREIDEENAEAAARERELARHLSKEHAESVLKEEMAVMEAKREERTKKMIFAARRDAERYEGRLKKLYAEILGNIWQSERELRTQAGVMEQSLSDKLYSTWLIELLEQRDPPPKPLQTPKPKPKSSTANLSSGSFDDEVLTSSDEGEFIVPDENDDDDDDDDMVMADTEPSPDAPQLLPLRLTREPSCPPSDVESDMVVDLTLLESPETIKDSKTAIQYIDLTSPVKREVSMARFVAEKSLSVFDLPEEVPPMDHLGSLEAIGEHTAKHWAKQKDRWRLVLCLLWKLPQTRRGWIFQLVQARAPEEAWQASVPLYQTNPFGKESDIGKEETKTVAFDITKLFLSFTQCRQIFFSTFHAFIKEWAPQFPQSSQIFRTDAFDDEIGLEEADEYGPNITDTPSKARKLAAKEIVQNKEGVDLRERERKRAEELEARRVKLRAALATSNAIPVEKSRVIINESKEDDQSFIYVNDEIGKLIKNHQINGVRFLWEQIVLDANERKERQGCLLAHTMGLGKTMQVITFLVAMIEAANSDDESVRSQIPKELRKSQSLVLCPAGLVDNWLDEILMWSPKGLLGHVFKVESAQKGDIRMSTVRDWEREGGVLVIGHKMFEKSDNDMREILTQTPNIVICDEAHVMKNPKSKIHRACQEFRTKSRIALTGSPLSNNVEEYYWMINWVAPKFLGPQEEFRDIYVNPIQCGLWHDSSGYEKRRALKMLEVLKLNVAPKVQRATTQCVKHELPAKYEFVIFVEPTRTQKMLYNLYLTEMAPYLEDSKQAKIFSASEHLRLICNHPRCFRQKVLEMSSKANVPGLSRALTAAQQREMDEIEDDTDDDCVDKIKAPAMTFPQSMISSVLKETNRADNANPTLSRKVELLLMVLDEARAIGDKVLVFSQSLLTLNYLDNLFKQQRRAVCRLDGSTAVSKRQEQIKAFNTGKQEIYLISTQAGGVGLNIFGANRVVIFDFKWNPVTEQQAVGRAYRFGQEKTVYVYQFVVSGAFEEALQNKTVFKMQLASRVVDKKKPVSWGKRVGELLQPIKAKPARDLSHFKGRDRILDKLIEHSQPCGAIREIISTDTFEEEDPTNELTEAERKDAQELHDLQRIRYTDPERYRMMLDQKQRAEQILAMATAARVDTDLSEMQLLEQDLYIPPSSQPVTRIAGLAYNRAAALNANTEPLVQAQAAGIAPYGPPAHTPQFSSSAPLPMTGANTHILTSGASSILPTMPLNAAVKEPESGKNPRQELGSSLTGSAPAITPSIGTSLFSQPRSQVKIDFENELVKSMETQPEFKGNAANVARKLIEGITVAQRVQGRGFLPDNARWRSLLGHIQRHHRFMLSIAWGNCTPLYLATAPDEEIQNRIAIMNSQSEDDFSTQLRRTLETPDPSNLNNIDRPVPQSARATEDVQVMRRAADKRTNHPFQPLPTWANTALSQAQGQNAVKRR
ncbi:hypothetical protein TrVFT333_005486 [Trichoderma virens FT-333]|nr:hypothetical protein TrVFT333_005486 [Trichoderma virens FT-333]